MLTVQASSSTLYLKMHVFSEDFSLSTPEHKNTVFAMEKFVHIVFLPLLNLELTYVFLFLSAPQMNSLRWTNDFCRLSFIGSEFWTLLVIFFPAIS